MAEAETMDATEAQIWMLQHPGEPLVDKHGDQWRWDGKKWEFRVLDDSRWNERSKPWNFAPYTHPEPVPAEPKVVRLGLEFDSAGLPWVSSRRPVQVDTPLAKALTHPRCRGAVFVLLDGTEVVTGVPIIWGETESKSWRVYQHAGRGIPLHPVAVLWESKEGRRCH